ncbi:MAG: Rieske 2Fe-2S domain-containing protein, partial [Nitrososphaerota archaeon]|nr:Rieske 2Fe-2S domain-containing protein [Nitrososphaerota archaeon]
MTEENTLKDLEYFIAEMDGIPIAICRYRGKYYAYFDRCSHQGGPACEGSLKEMSKVSFKVMAVTSAP